jgi:hypothetical protein
MIGAIRLSVGRRRPVNDQVDALSQALNYMRSEPYAPFRYSGLPRYDRATWGSGQRGPDSCAEADALEDLTGGPSTFIHSADQMRAISAVGGRDRVRWPSLSRRRAW